LAIFYSAVIAAIYVLVGWNTLMISFVMCPQEQCAVWNQQ